MAATFRRTIAVATVLTLMLSVAPAAVARPQIDHKAQDHFADAVVRRAARALGHIDRADGLTVSAEGTRWTLDEGFSATGGASRPGPYSVEATFDLDGDRMRLDYDLVSFGFVERQISELADAEAGFLIGQDNNFAPPGEFAMSPDRWASTRVHQMLTNPAVLVAALADGSLDVASVRRARVDDRRGFVLTIEHAGAPIEVSIDGRSGRLTSIRTLENNPLRRDVTLEVVFGDWQRVGRRGAFPMHMAVFYAGELVQEETRTSVALLDEIDDGVFEPPADVPASPSDPQLVHRGIVSHQHLQSFAALGFPVDGRQVDVVPLQVAPGVQLLTGGSHNSLLVEHDAGFVLVDAPLDQHRVGALLAHIESLGADGPLTHVVQSHFHADHSGGIRTALAGGAALATHESAADLYGRVFAAASTVVPDAFAASGAVPAVHTVADGDTLVVGTGSNAVGLYPMVQDHSEDFVLVVAGGVAFVVDLYNPVPGVPAPAAAQVILDTIVDNDLDVHTIAGGHAGFVSFEEFVDLLP